MNTIKETIGLYFHRLLLLLILFVSAQFGFFERRLSRSRVLPIVSTRSGGVPRARMRVSSVPVDLDLSLGRPMTRGSGGGGVVRQRLVGDSFFLSPPSASPSALVRICNIYETTGFDVSARKSLSHNVPSISCGNRCRSLCIFPLTCVEVRLLYATRGRTRVYLLDEKNDK